MRGLSRAESAYGGSGVNAVTASSGYSVPAASGSSDPGGRGFCGESVNILPMEHCLHCGGELMIIAAVLE